MKFKHKKTATEVAAKQNGVCFKNVLASKYFLRTNRAHRNSCLALQRARRRRSGRWPQAPHR